MATGLFGKLPAHGDFVRRRLPEEFCEPWDAWLQAGIAAARDELGEGFAEAWDSAPAWRFRLPRGACGPAAVAGVLLPSEDLVGRHFPLTLAALLPGGSEPPASGWYEALEVAGRAGRDSGESADALLAALPEAPWPDGDDAPAEGWWMEGELRWDLPALPAATQFRILLEGGA
jgi:type VI secretion system protein ImpM